MTPDEFRAKYPADSTATHDANGKPLRGPALGPDGAVYVGGPGEPPTVLTQMPVPGLDDLTPDDVAREVRGAVYKAQELVKRAATDESRAHAQRALDALLAHAEREGVTL